jgi:membrane protease YdiL (CAAX protease family)
MEAVFRSLILLNDGVLFRVFGREGWGPVLVLAGEAILSLALFHWTLGWGQIWALLQLPKAGRTGARKRGRSGRWPWVLAGFGGIVVFLLLAALCATFVQESYQPSMSRGPLGLAFVLLFTLGGLAEEIYFRGIVFTGLNNSFGPGAGTALTSLWFAALHTLDSPLGWNSVPIFAFLFAFSMAGCLVRHYSRSLLPFAITYSGFNFVNAALGMMS